MEKKVRNFRLSYSNNKSLELCRINIEQFANEIAFIYSSEKLAIMAEPELIDILGNILRDVRVGFTKKSYNHKAGRLLEMDEDYMLARENNILIFSYVVRSIEIEELEPTSLEKDNCAD